MKTKLVVALLALGMLTGVLWMAAPVRGVVTLALDPPKFHVQYYVPGEQLRFTVSIASTDPRTWDIVVAWNDGVTFTNYSGNRYDDITIPAPATSVTLNFNIPDVNDPIPMPDGDWYFIEVHDANWIENGGGGPFAAWQFSIRTWSMRLETNRAQYLPGDNVTVSWSVNLIRDGSPAPVGDGQLWLHDWPNYNALITNPRVFTDSSGQFSFRLLGTIPNNQLIRAEAWFNDTRSNADRFVWSTAAATVDGLRMIVTVAAGTYEPGGIVTVDVAAKITDSPFPNPNHPGAAGVEVDLSVTDLSTGRVEALYGAQNVLTDSNGNLRHVFQLNTSIPDGTAFQVRADGLANNAVIASATGTFVVNSRAGMSLVLGFDKSQYLSGDTVTMTVDVTGSSGPFTYTYEARDASPGGGLLDRRTLMTRVYTYTIPTTFDGPIQFSVFVDDGQGNRRFAAQPFTVLLGILVVNLDRAEYNGGDVITATWSLTRNPGVLKSPTYYYEVFDVNGVLVGSGIASGSSVPFQTPIPPLVSSTRYMFQVTATEGGRALSGSSAAVLVSGVLLSIGFDRAAYNPGETMRITYTLTPRGRTTLPATFLFFIAMPGAPPKTVQTTASSGELTYTVPAGMNQGSQLVTVQEVNTFAFAVETVTIGQANPLWADVGGIPAIVVAMGLLLALLFIFVFLMWRRMMPGMAPRAPGERPPMERPAEQATAQPGPAPMSVTCKACGAPIEITTSKRPIEVMCPSCGETQMVQ